MSPLPRSSNSRAGFSMVELMLGLTLGLLALLAISQAYLSFHRHRHSTGGVIDAQTAAMGALFAIERDVQQAGAGLSDARLIGCSVSIGSNAAAPLVPVRIEAGLNGAPDTLVLLAGDRLAAPARLGAALDAADTGIVLASTMDMRPGDILGLHEAGQPCALVQITTVDSALRVSHVAPSPAGEAAAAMHFSSDAMAFNLGRLGRVAYTVADGELRRATGGHAGPGSATQAVAGTIVSLKAQYGFDTRPTMATALQVTRWSASMLDADGSGAKGDRGDWQRLAGLRIAVVARSPHREGGGACALSAAGKAQAPGWQAPDDQGVLVDAAISLAHVPDWQCYRYRTYETVVPLRNVIWGRP